MRLVLGANHTKDALAAVRQKRAKAQTVAADVSNATKEWWTVAHESATLHVLNSRRYSVSVTQQEHGLWNSSVTQPQRGLCQ